MAFSILEVVPEFGVEGGAAAGNAFVAAGVPVGGVIAGPEAEEVRGVNSEEPVNELLLPEVN